MLAPISVFVLLDNDATEEIDKQYNDNYNHWELLKYINLIFNDTPVITFI